MKHENMDKITDNNENTTNNPNFVLWDNRVSSDFSKMCQNFQNQPNLTSDNADWLIIDNDTGEIICADK
jgi:hypothetical protein